MGNRSAEDDLMDSRAPSATAVATFARRDDADTAIHALHRAGYRHTWLGVTGAVDEKGVEPAAPAILRWLHRDDARTLYDVLRDHGVLEEDARAIDGSVVEGDCVLVVEDARSAARVAKIVRECGGAMRAESVEHPAEPEPVERAVEGKAPTLREDVFVRRHLPSSDEPAPY
jgi:hypothetical protein